MTILLLLSFMLGPSKDTIGQTHSNIGISGYPKITNFSPKDYGGSSQNWNIVQDKNGTMYFANSGIVIYDGVEWSSVIDPKLPIVRGMDIDEDGRLFVGGPGEFGYFEKDDIGKLHYNSLVDYLDDSQKSFNDTWSIYCTDQGIFFQARERVFRFVENSDGGWNVNSWDPTDQFMYAFYNDNSYYVHQRSVGLMKLVGDELSLIPGSEILANDRVQIMMPWSKNDDGESTYLIAQFTQGMYMFDGKSFTRFKSDLDEVSNTSLLYKAVELDDGNIAVSTTGEGIMVMNREGRLLGKINQESGTRDDNVYAMRIDQQGALWMALDNGISRVAINSPFTFYDQRNGLESSIYCVHQHLGKIYVGTATGLFRLNEKNSRFEEIQGIPKNQIFEMVSADNVLFVANDGLFAVGPDDRVHTVLESVGSEYQIQGLYTSDRRPEYIFAGLQDGLIVLKKEEGQSSVEKSWTFLGRVPGVTETVSNIVLTDDMRIWLGTQLGAKTVDGMNFDDPTSIYDDLVVNDVTFPSASDESGVILAEANGKLFFLTLYNLFSYDPDKRMLVEDSSFSELERRPEMQAGIIQEDIFGRVWVNFGGETAMATLNEDGDYDLDKTPFLPFAETLVSDVYADEDQITWISSLDGLIRYDEQKIKSYTFNYAANLRTVQYGEELLPLSSFAKPKLSYDHSALTFEYAVPFFEEEESTMYQTWLEGFDRDWSRWQPLAQKEYTNLTEGQYTFHVRAKNIYQSVSGEATYTFQVLPPWYRSIWAYLAYILGAGLLIVALIRWWTGRLREHQIELEKRVKERTAQVQLQADKLATVNEVSKALASQLHSDELIELVGDQMLHLFKANIVYVALLNEETQIIEFPYQRGDDIKPMKFGEGLTSKIIKTKEPLLINKDVQARVSKLNVGTIGIPAASYLGVPIPLGEKIIGVLSVQSTEQENRFGDKDKDLLSTIAAHVGVAIHNAQLFEEAEEAQAQAEEANEAKSSFLSTVSHELRTPLTSVLGFAKIIKKRLDERVFPKTDISDKKTERAVNQVSQNLAVVVSEGERLTKLINDVLDLAKIEAGKIEMNMAEITMPEILEMSLAATSSLFEQKGLDLRTNFASDLPSLTGDKDKLIQVIINLLSNAVKFTDNGSVVLESTASDEEIIIKVSDSGIGISEADLDMVFEKFKQVGDTLTDKPKGTGLGLPICKEIIERHGGRIWAESELGKGSVFSFAIPIVSSGQSAIKPMQLEELVTKLKKQISYSPLTKDSIGRSILVVDDDAPIRNLLKQELGDLGYQIREATNGKEAVESVRKERPDLIILDVMMPEMNGFDVAAVLKNDPTTMDIPIIILSIVQDKSRGFRIGVDRYLTKPINTEELFSEVGNLLTLGKSPKKVMVVDENESTVQTLAEVLTTRGYEVVESNGSELIKKAVSSKPDIIILNSMMEEQQEQVRSLRFEKGLENVLFLVYK